MVVRTGINESDVIDQGQYGFVVASAYADKRLGRKSAIQLGARCFLFQFSKRIDSLPKYRFSREIMWPRMTDYKRVGVFVGHELFINKMSIISQLGYYVYYPFDFEGRMYNRMGIKRYFGDKVFGSVTLKSHGAKAEAVEFGVGIRL